MLQINPLLCNSYVRLEMLQFFNSIVYRHHDNVGLVNVLSFNFLCFKLGVPPLAAQLQAGKPTQKFELQD